VITWFCFIVVALLGYVLTWSSGCNYAADGHCRNVTGLQLPGVIDELYAYDGPLGAVFSGESISLHLWAPTAQVCHQLLSFLLRDVIYLPSPFNCLQLLTLLKGFLSPASEFAGCVCQHL